MKTANISFAVMALLYSASATEVQQMSALGSTSSVVTQGWCDMSQVQKGAWVKSQWTPTKAQLTKLRADMKTKINGALANYKMARKEISSRYKATRTGMITAFRAAIKVQPKEKRKAIITAFRKDLTDRRNALKAQLKTLMDRFRSSRKALNDTYRKQVKSSKAETKTKVNAFKKTRAECEAMESSSEEEPEPVTESETEEETASEATASEESEATASEESEATASEESEATASEESESELNPTTKAMKVTQNCKGSIDRLKNEQTADIFELAKRSKGTYEDISFPADESSLWWNASTNTSVRVNWKTRNFTWKRAFDIKEGTLWGSKGILPAGVRQGGVGDCWWVAVASALAEHPDRIKKIFKNYDQAKGIYEFEMWSQGVPAKVVVDDRLVMNGKRPQAHMAHQSANGAWWLPLLQKGAAKFFGTYEKMWAGWGFEAWTQLTGYPMKGHNFRGMTEHQILDVIKTADDKHHVMWASPTRYGNHDVGLYKSHVYSVLGHTHWNGMDFVQFRNPWGRGEFTGQWNDKDTTTDAAQLAAFRAHVKENEKHETTWKDGKFWMVLADVKKYIGGVEVGLYLDDWIPTTVISKPAYNTKAPYTLNNPVKQDLIAHFGGLQDRQWMDRSKGCLPPRMDMIYPTIHLKVNGKRISYKQMQTKDMQFLEFKDMPAGEYAVENWGKSFGNERVNLRFHAQKQEVTIA